MSIRKICLVSMMLLLLPAYLWAGEVSVWSGGVGEEERLAAPDGNVKIVLFQEGGKYVVDAEIVIRDLDHKKAVVVREKVEGPWCIVDLPPGRYSLIAIRESGDSEGVRFTVKPNKKIKLPLKFPAR